MPELPEVEVVRRGLEPYVVNRVISRVIVRDSRSLKRDRNPHDFVPRLTGARIVSVVRRGKFMWCPLQFAGQDAITHALVIHLGMSGQLRVRSDDDPAPALTKIGAVNSAESTVTRRGEGIASDPAKHVRIRLFIENDTVVDFVDQRIFGSMRIDNLVPTVDGYPAGAGSQFPLIPESVTHIARDLVDPACDKKQAAKAFVKRNTSVKQNLLAQNIVSGIGNIYADEALFAAEVHPSRKCSSLSQKKFVEILEEAEKVMRRALAQGGTSFDTLYVNVDGRSGYFARSLNAYGKAGQPCTKCDTILKVIKIQGRSCYYCERCQPPPRI